MTILGVDLSSNNSVFDFALGYQQGVRACYVKLGGDNIPRYVSGSYQARVDASRAHGMITGHYWVTGGHDPEAAAQFFVRNLRNVQPGDFFVLDNEKLDDGNMYSDDEAARWIRTVQALVGGSPRRVFMYASGSPMKSSSWAAVRATGAQALVAWYDIGQWGFPQPLGSWPAEQIGGHQYTSGANLGNGGRIDANVFKDNAFTFTTTAAPIIIGDTEMPTIVQVADVPGKPLYAVSPGAIAHQTGDEAGVALTTFNQTGGARQLNTKQFNALLHSLQIPVNQAYHYGGHPIGWSWSQNGALATTLAAVQEKLAAS